MRAIVTMLAGLAATAVFATGAMAESDIKVGLITSMSGPISSIGIPYSKGLKAGVAHINEVDGHKVQLIQLDDASNPSESTRNARKLIEEEKVDAIICCGGSPLTAAVAGVSYESKVPLIAIAPIGIGGERGTWHIVVPISATLMLEADVAQMKKAGVKTVAYIGYSDAWGDLVYNGLVHAAAPAGIKIVTNERYARADTSVTAQALKIIAARPDAVLTGGSGTPGALPQIDLVARGWKGPVYSTIAIVNPDFIRVGGQAVEGVITTINPVMVADELPDSNPMKKVGLEYKAIYQKTLGEPSKDVFAPYAYDGYLLFIDAAKRALKKAQPGTPAFRTALRDALYDTKNFVGTSAIYNYKPGQQYGADERAMVMVKLVKGEWRLLK
jgi:branched-chain amino acid transport system substrate-binding protein